MICKKCSSKINDGALACPSCGTSIEELKNNGLIVVENTQSSTQVNQNNLNTVQQPENLNNSNKKEKSNFISKLKKVNKIPLICGGIVLLLLIGFILYYFLVLNIPKSVFKTATNKLYSELNDGFKSAGDYDSISVNSNLDMNMKVTDESLSFISDIFNKIDMSMNCELDYKNNIANIDYDIKYDDSQLLKSSINMIDDNYYVYLEGLYDKYIKMDSEELKGLFEESNENYEDLNIVLKEVKNAFNDSLKSDYFEKSNETIEINGKDTKVKKNTLILNEKNTSEIIKSMVNYLKNNDKFLNSLSKISNESESDIKADLDSILEEELEFEETYELSLYTKGFTNKLVRVDITGENFDIEVTEDTEEKASLKITIDNVVLTGTAEVTGDDENSNVKLSLSFIGNTIEINMSTNTKYNTTVNAKEITDAVDYNSLTEADENKISENLMKQEGFIKLYQDINSIMGTTALESEDEYYDYQ